jgi:hypothetical protein
MVPAPTHTYCMWNQMNEDTRRHRGG